MSQLMTQGFVRRNLYTNHYPYNLHCPDLLGAMPALLLEMAVFSMPGEVEFMPAMPENLEEDGQLNGIWLYTWAKLESMKWDTKGVKAVLTSKEKQGLKLRCRKNVKSFMINGVAKEIENGVVKYAFEAGETIEIAIEY